MNKFKIVDFDKGGLAELSAPEPVELFTSLPQLAERLAVKEGEGEEFGKVWLELRDGRKYNFLALVHALLDRMERVS